MRDVYLFPAHRGRITATAKEKRLNKQKQTPVITTGTTVNGYGVKPSFFIEQVQQMRDKRGTKAINSPDKISPRSRSASSPFIESPSLLAHR